MKRTLIPLSLFSALLLTGCEKAGEQNGSSDEVASPNAEHAQTVTRLVHPAVFEMALGWISDTVSPVVTEVNLDAIYTNRNQFDYDLVKVSESQGPKIVHYQRSEGGYLSYKVNAEKNGVTSITLYDSGGGSGVGVTEITYEIKKRSVRINGVSREIEVLRILGVDDQETNSSSAPEGEDEAEETKTAEIIFKLPSAPVDPPVIADDPDQDTLEESDEGPPYAQDSADLWPDIYSLKRDAAEGSPTAQCALGLRYTKGDGVQKNLEEAVRWYRMAAEQEDAWGQFLLGMCYSDGRGVVQDDQEAAAWVRKSADQGLVAAQYSLGVMYGKGEGVPEDSSEAIKWYRKAAEQGFAQAQLALGWSYFAGSGVDKDLAEGLRWFRSAADQGFAEGQFLLGMFYDYGQDYGFGVEADDQEAAKWYRLAAEKGNAKAATNLGILYYLGDGVTKSIVEAHAWVTFAMQLGDSKAPQIIARLESEMTNEEITKAAEFRKSGINR